jgi:hypothetical protein
MTGTTLFFPAFQKSCNVHIERKIRSARSTFAHEGGKEKPKEGEIKGMYSGQRQQVQRDVMNLIIFKEILYLHQ